MRTFLLVMIIAVASIFMVSCGEKQQEPEQIDKKTGKKIPGPNASIEQRMEEFNVMMTSQLEIIKRKTNDLKSKTGQVASENQAEFTKALEILKRHQKRAREELEKLEKATSSNWDKFAPRMDSVMKDLKQAYAKAESLLKKETESSDRQPFE